MSGPPWTTRADSLDDSSSDCGLLRVYANSKQQQFDLSDACSTVSSSTDTLLEAANSFDFDLDLLNDCQVPSLELPFPELTDSSRKESGDACQEFCAYDETLSSCCGLSPQQVGRLI